jgi:hypothetical protein
VDVLQSSIPTSSKGISTDKVKSAELVEVIIPGGGLQMALKSTSTDLDQFEHEIGCGGGSGDSGGTFLCFLLQHSKREQ